MLKIATSPVHVYKFLLLGALVCLALLVGCQKGPPAGNVEKLFDEHSTADIVFFYTKTSTHDERTDFYENVLNERSAGGGYWPRSGVILTWGVNNHSYEGHALNFDPAATTDERQAVVEVLRASPVVFRVYENRVPEEINDLP